MNIFTRFGSALDRAASNTIEAAQSFTAGVKTGIELAKLAKDDPILLARQTQLAEMAEQRIEEAEIRRAAAKEAEHRNALAERKLKRLEALRSEALQLMDELKQLGVEVL